MGSSNLEFKYLMENSPHRMGFEAVQTLDRGYLSNGETPLLAIERICKRFIEFYPDGYNGVLPYGLYRMLKHALLQSWISPSTPVWSNFGADDGLGVSCFLINPGNNLHEILMAGHEIGMLTKEGGGIGIDISNLKGITKINSWAKLYDEVIQKCTQSNTRRGNLAIYLDVHHSDIELFLEAKDLLKGDLSTKIVSNIAIKIDNKFIQQLKSGNERALRIMQKILELRLKYGSPYIFYSDNAKDADPEWYKDKGLQTVMSNLCIEIFLHTDSEHTASCMITNLNTRYYDEWKNMSPISLPELGILLLDAVNEDFIIRASSLKHPEGYQKAVRGAIKGRPLGMGTYGYHAYLMSKMIPFESEKARVFNREYWKFVRKEAEKATRILAEEKGEPEWCKGWKRRNTHLLSQPPSTSSSVLGDGFTPGIQPMMGNYFSKSGAKGTFTRKNPFLEEILEERGKNTDIVWVSIREKFGSVQHLDFLTDIEKEVFKTFFEIDQMEILIQAADRQKFIDQGQSLNLFIPPTEDAQVVVDLHVKAWELGLKGLYYVYSESVLAQNKDNSEIYVYMGTRDDCPYCVKAKALLESKGIHYIYDTKPEGRVPEIWVNGEQLDDGYTSLVKYLNATEANEVVEQEENCSGCAG